MMSKKETSEAVLRGEEGMTTIEVVLIIAVLVALVVIFRNEITGMVSQIFSSIKNTASQIY